MTWVQYGDPLKQNGLLITSIDDFKYKNIDEVKRVRVRACFCDGKGKLDIMVMAMVS